MAITSIYNLQHRTRMTNSTLSSQLELAVLSMVSCVRIVSDISLTEQLDKPFVEMVELFFFSIHKRKREGDCKHKGI